MNQIQIKEAITNGDLVLTDVIDAVIDINGIIGVGLITLGDDIQKYIQFHPTQRNTVKTTN
tara:strand:+ start:539 stop:721 length:183 start_codon:yes stop_codon:yes gene_type:complete